MKENIVQRKSLDFSIRIVNTYRHLALNNKEFILSKQLLRSGTSIGANVEEIMKIISKILTTTKKNIN